MSFFKKTANYVGISTVELRLESPATFSRDQSSVDGRLHIESLGEHTIHKVEVLLVQPLDEDDDEYHVYLDRSTRRSEKVLGKDLLCNQEVPIQQGETLSAEFSIKFEMDWSLAGELHSMGGFLGAVGRAHDMLSQGLIPDYRVVARVSLGPWVADPETWNLIRLHTE